MVSWWDETEDDFGLFADLNTETGNYFQNHTDEIVADPSEAIGRLRQLQNVVTDLQSHGPVPIASIDEPWQQMLDEAEQSYSLAIEGLETSDSALVAEGGTHLQLVTGYMNDAAAAIQAWSPR